MTKKVILLTYVHIPIVIMCRNKNVKFLLYIFIIFGIMLFIFQTMKEIVIWIQ